MRMTKVVVVILYNFFVKIIFGHLQIWRRSFLESETEDILALYKYASRQKKRKRLLGYKINKDDKFPKKLIMNDNWTIYDIFMTIYDMNSTRESHAILPHAWNRLPRHVYSGLVYRALPLRPLSYANFNVQPLIHCMEIIVNAYSFRCVMLIRL